MPLRPLPRIEIRNARCHNLRGFDCEFPLGAMTVVTGVSGSGKSSLAFDTLYAEGQRRFVTSLSTYARQFLERLPRPAVDSISHLPPAIAIERRNRAASDRATVGTASEVIDSLRVLFARCGQMRCPECETRVVTGGAVSVAERLEARFDFQRIQLAAPFGRHGVAGDAVAYRDRMAAAGHTRVLDLENRVVDWSAASPSEVESLLAGGLLLVDRLVPDRGAGRRRLLEAVEVAFDLGAGEVVVVDAAGHRESLRDAFGCPGCGTSYPEISVELLSFDRPAGACGTCQGLGRVPVLDLERVVPDPGRSLEGGAVAPFESATGREPRYEMLRHASARGISGDRAFSELSDSQREWVVEGDGVDWKGVRGFFADLAKTPQRRAARTLIARYRRFAVCPECQGTRLSREARSVEVEGQSLAAIAQRCLAEVAQWVSKIEPPTDDAPVRQTLLRLRARLADMQAVGLGYLGLDRSLQTLSGGEAQRLQLATALGGGLRGVLYVLDEPSVGLHPRDRGQLLAVLASIRARGNTVVIVEHSPEVLAAADHVIELGPAAGRRGGLLVAEGTLDAVRKQAGSLAGRLLGGEFAVRAAGGKREPRRAVGEIRVVGARENNLANLDVGFPLGALTVVTGVSGAGKSSLVHSVLVGNLLGRPERGACDAVEGARVIRGVEVVDTTPIVKSARSNPATYSKAFDAIRRRFAATREARALGASAGWFSFNVAGGRCDVCEGAGEVVIDMQFLEDLRVPCDACNGLRYRREALGVRVEGRSIVEVLALEVDEAREVFADDAAIATKLEPLSRLGLGYLRLGQPLSTLSSGEQQRLRLALGLAADPRDRLFVLDEPTTGLHAADVAVLLEAFDALIASGGHVVVVEHNLDVVRHADFVIDLGPEGGPGGGRIVAQGTPLEVARVEASHTGAALRAAGV